MVNKMKSAALSTSRATTFTYTPRGSSKPAVFTVPPMDSTRLISNQELTGMSDIAALDLIPMDLNSCQVNIEPPVAWDPRWEWAEYIAPIMDQGQCGSCWAFASSQSLSSRFAFFTNQKVQPLSPVYMVLCATPEFSPVREPMFGCSGGSLVEAFWFTDINGIVTTSCLPVSLNDWTPGQQSVRHRIVPSSTLLEKPAQQMEHEDHKETTNPNTTAEVFVSCPLNT